MKTIFLTTTLLLAGAAAFPAAARDHDRDGWRSHDSHEPVAESRDHRHDRRDERGDDRYDRRDDRRDDRYERRDDRHDRREDRRDDRRMGYREWRHEGRHWEGRRHHAPYRYVYPRGYRDYSWRVGYRLPPPYYARSYYVDYRYYGLPSPRHGYQWVRINNDVVLVAIATGLIYDAMYDLFY